MPVRKMTDSNQIGQCAINALAMRPHSPDNTVNFLTSMVPPLPWENELSYGTKHTENLPLIWPQSNCKDAQCALQNSMAP